MWDWDITIDELINAIRRAGQATRETGQIDPEMLKFSKVDERFQPTSGKLINKFGKTSIMEAWQKLNSLVEHGRTGSDDYGRVEDTRHSARSVEEWRKIENQKERSAQETFRSDPKTIEGVKKNIATFLHVWKGNTHSQTLRQRNELTQVAGDYKSINDATIWNIWDALQKKGEELQPSFNWR